MVAAGRVVRRSSRTAMSTRAQADAGDEGNFAPRTFDVRSFRDVNGTLAVPYEKSEGIDLARVFTVHAGDNSERGRHAHRECTQILFAASGRVRVDAVGLWGQASFTLDDPSKGLVLFPMTWSVQVFEVESVLVVLCDVPFAEDEYIRDWASFARLAGL